MSGSRAQASAVERLVVRPPNWLGDAVLALPAMAAIRRTFPAAELTIAGRASVTALFREQTAVAPDRVIDLPDRHGEAIAALEAGRFDLGILFPNSFRSAWQFRRARIGQRWGYGRSGRSFLLTRRSRPDGPRGPHQADYYRDLVRGLGMACDADAMPRVTPSALSAGLAAAVLERYRVPPGVPLVGFAPGAAYGQAKQWPPDRVADVMARVQREAGARVVIVGAAHDRDAARAIESWFAAHAADLAPAVINLAGRTNLGTLVGLLARMSAFVSNDSGAMHLAAAVGLPVVAIFGATNEHATHPLGDHDVLTADVFCRPCMLRDCPIDHRCMTRVTADRVYAALARRLSPAAPADLH